MTAIFPNRIEDITEDSLMPFKFDLSGRNRHDNGKDIRGGQVQIFVRYEDVDRFTNYVCYGEVDA
jgi:hypothetical protein